MKKIALALILGYLTVVALFAQNGITGTNIRIHATFHHVGVQVNFTGDLDSNATAHMEANINGTGFKPVHRLSRVGHDR
ncbi:MAG TPA: hypothetical protein ENJ82_10480, partial [Bacteroidetes bacterium]|nr:hypothetical protein [Bacteroidota bacterium]